MGGQFTNRLINMEDVFSFRLETLISSVQCQHWLPYLQTMVCALRTCDHACVRGRTISQLAAWCTSTTPFKNNRMTSKTGRGKKPEKKVVNACFCC